jgi:hypothetical protein
LLLPQEELMALQPHLSQPLPGLSDRVLDATSLLQVRLPLCGLVCRSHNC